MKVLHLSIGLLVGAAGIAHASGNAAPSSQSAFGVSCSEIFERGIDKQENLRATMIRVACGLDAPGELGPEGLGMESPEDFTNINLITGAEIFPNVTQSESMVWSTPDGQTVVVQYNDSKDRNASPIIIAGISVSFDAGATFTRLNPNPLVGHAANFGDPIVVYNNALSKWFTGDLVGGCGGQGIGLWTSVDAMTWTVGACAHNGSSDDRESMWVDNNAGSPFYGRMYISWNDFAAGQNIFVTHSDDGTTWSAPVRVQTGTFIRNIQLTGSPDGAGTVFIAGMDEGGGGVANRINWIYRSLDGGQTWTAIQQGPPFGAPGEPLCGYFAAIPPIWRHMGWGQPAVGPGGVVHYVYAGRGSNPGDEGDIYYIRSDDNGDHWTAPITLNTDAAAGGSRSQWMPSLSVTPEGNVVATWYDRRSTTNTSYEYWIIQSADNGQTWGSDQPVSDVISPQPEQPDPGIQACYAGDYNYQSSISTNTWVTWTDGRVQVSGHNQQDVFFAAVPQITTGGALQGTIYDTTGIALQGARVQAVGPVTRVASSNSDGLYRFVGMPAGTYDLTVTAADHDPGSATGIAVEEGQTTTQDFTLTGVGILFGAVTDSSGSPIIADVQVVGPVTRSRGTDVTGLYSFRLPVGNYNITVTTFAYNPGTANVDILDGATTTQNFALTLAPAHNVSGTITSSVTGLPVPNATVRVLGTPIDPVTSDANGMYQILGVPDGSYDLRASPPPSAGLQAKTVPIVVDMDITVDIALDGANLSIAFEPPDYSGSPTGVLATGQQGWYVPNVAGSTDEFIFTYENNALNLPSDPNGETQFLGARVSVSGSLNRAQLDFDWSNSTVWTVSYDMAVRWNGTGAAVDNNSSFSLQDNLIARYFIALNHWRDFAGATRWDADYQVFDAAGNLIQVVAGPQWNNLPVNHWFRQSTTFDFDSNRILSVSITDLDTGVTTTIEPTNWYLTGGATGRPPLPTALRFFVGGDTTTLGNTAGFDNLQILSGGPFDRPTGNSSGGSAAAPAARGSATN